MRYQIKLINLETGETKLTNWVYSNRKDAKAFAQSWRDMGLYAEVIDTKKKEVIF